MQNLYTKTKIYVLGGFCIFQGEKSGVTSKCIGDFYMFRGNFVFPRGIFVFSKGVLILSPKYSQKNSRRGIFEFFREDFQFFQGEKCWEIIVFFVKVRINIAMFQKLYYLKYIFRNLNLLLIYIESSSFKNRLNSTKNLVTTWDHPVKSYNGFLMHVYYHIIQCLGYASSRWAQIQVQVIKAARVIHSDC